MSIKKIIYISVGCFGVGIGAVGAVVPMLPSFPFLLLAAFCFGRSSERLNDWFIHTRLYQENLESYIKERGMTAKAKIRIMILVTILMSIGFMMMSRVPTGRVILVFVWLFHLFYFLFGIKTIE
ncbi:MAG: YbaN family protein [Lachnospiraceae bacterium]